MLDREMNKLSARVKAVHLHQLILVEFDSSRRNRKVVRDRFRRTPLRKQLQYLSLARRERLRAFSLGSSIVPGFRHHRFGQ